MCYYKYIYTHTHIYIYIYNIWYYWACSLRSKILPTKNCMAFQFTVWYVLWRSTLHYPFQLCISLLLVHHMEASKLLLYCVFKSFCILKTSALEIASKCFLSLPHFTFKLHLNHEWNEPNIYDYVYTYSYV